jgi:hypothetical protein
MMRKIKVEEIIEWFCDIWMNCYKKWKKGWIRPKFIVK